MDKYFYKSFIIFIFLSTCAPTRMALPEDKSKFPILLPFKINELKINDQRECLKSMDWKIPAVFEGKKQWIGNPVISQKDKEDIDRIVRSTEPKEDGIPANFEIKLFDGECKLKMDSSIIWEIITIKAELTVFIPSRSKKLEAAAEGHYEYPVYTASKEHVIQLYNLVLKNVTAELLKEVRDDIK